MNYTEDFQAVAPVNLREKYDHASEEWFRVRSAIRTGALRYVAPAFRVGGRRIYCRADLDRELSLRKFGDDIAKARAHRVCDSPLVPLHLAPVEATPPPLCFERAYQLAWQEHRALARLASPPQRNNQSKSASVKWALTYDLNSDGEFKLSGSMGLKSKKEQKRGSV